MIQGALGWCSLLGLALSLGCSGGDTTLERRGGPLPDASSGGSAGASGEGSAGDASASAIPPCVLDVIVAKCQRCHGDPRQNGAPVSFFTVDDFQAPYFDTKFKWWEIAIDRVESDVMPFVALNDPPTNLMPPVQPLTAEEKATLLAWLRAGALPDDGTQCQ